MCTFISSLPQHSASVEKRPSLQLFIRPTQTNEFYRFRLLAFNSPSKNDRDYPFIERYIHQHWSKTDEGKPCIDSTVVCPVTTFVKTSGNPYDKCPICKYSNINFLAWKESNYTNKESAKKNREFGRKFEAVIPVYVVNDPLYPKNNNRFKVIIFSDKKFYKQFKDLIQSTNTNQGINVFNGHAAVDFYLHMSEVPTVKNEGLPTEYTYKEKVIDKFGFTKADKAYDIPAISKENIDNFEFDDTYYVTSSDDELAAFYNRFIKISNDDIPEEDIGVFQQSKKPSVKKTNTASSTSESNTKKIEEIKTTVAKDSSDIDFISEVLSDNDSELAAMDKPKQKTNSVTKASTVDEDLDTLDIDQLIDGLDCNL